VSETACAFIGCSATFSCLPGFQAGPAVEQSVGCVAGLWETPSLVCQATSCGVLAVSADNWREGGERGIFKSPVRCGGPPYEAPPRCHEFDSAYVTDVLGCASKQDTTHLHICSNNRPLRMGSALATPLQRAPRSPLFATAALPYPEPPPLRAKRLVPGPCHHPRVCAWAVASLLPRTLAAS
jgi:hypothetical protein